jgi:acyl carrier protein
MTISRQIRRFLLRDLLDGRAGVDDPLAAGLIDSLGMEQLIAFLEERFCVVFDPGELSASNFESLDVVADLVASKTRPTAPSG